MVLLDAPTALNFVQSVKTVDGLTLYDEVKVALARALDTKPANLYDVFETGYLAKPETNHRDNAPLVASTVSARCGWRTTRYSACCAQRVLASI